MDSVQTSGNSSILIWVVILVIVFLAILVMAFLLSRETKSPKNMSKKDLEAVLEASADETKKVTTDALNDIADRVSREFEIELSNNIKISLQKFGQQQERTLGAAVNNYNENLANIQANVKRYLENTEKTIASTSADVDKRIEAAVAAQKAAVVGKVQTKINSILAAYLNQSLSGSIDISSQQEFILEQLEQSKPALIEDIQNVQS